MFPDQQPPSFLDPPAIARLAAVPLCARRPMQGNVSGRHPSPHRGASIEFAEYRKYVPGDDLRHVDWNAYARHEELFVKLGETTQGIDIHILLDHSPSMTWQPGWSAASAPGNGAWSASISKWDSARRLAGALGYLGLSSGERLIVTPFGSDLAESFGPTHGKRRIIPVLQYLTAVAPLSASNKGAESGLARCLAASS